MNKLWDKSVKNMEKIYRKGLGIFQNHIPLIGVYGVISVGKSTFLNALLKNNEFKAGNGETTKQLHIIKDIENQKHIELNNISLPVEYIFKESSLLKHFSIVDVPGTNKSFSDEDIEIIAKKLDVIIWIFNIHGDISERDVNFLKNVMLKNMVKTVVILNKIDSGMDDIDFDDAEEKEEFIEDIKSRQEKIIWLFKQEGAEELLVTVLPLSSKKLFTGVTKKKKVKFEQQHKKIEQILISVSKSAFMQKEIFRDSYNKIKEKVKKEIKDVGKKCLKNKQNSLQSKLNAISDNNMVTNNFNRERLLNKELSDFQISTKYKDELEKINQKIEENI